MQVQVSSPPPSPGTACACGEATEAEKLARITEVVEAFRKQGVSGSTTVKAMAFFLAACKDAKIEVSKYVRTPPIQKSNGTKKIAKGAIDDGDADDEDGLNDDGDDRGGPPLPDVDPALLSLMTKLPLPGEPMTKKERDRYAAFFSAVLSLLYPEADE